MSRMRVTTSLALIALCLAAVSASASITANTSAAASNTFQQTTNSPCVIGDPSCNQTLVYTQESGTPGSNGSTYDIFSPLYTASGSTVSGTSTIPVSFSIGVDENIAAGQGAEILQLFN